MTEPRPDWLDDADTDGLPDPPEPTLPKRFEDIDPDDAFEVMINGMQTALTRCTHSNPPASPYDVGLELDRIMPGLRLAWHRVFAFLDGPARATEAAALSLEARWADVMGDAEPGMNHMMSRHALASALGYMTASARDRGEQ